jgi:hypothetical protein
MTQLNINTALAKAQAEFKAVPFDSTNPFLKNRYASLGSVIQSSKPVLAKHGLAVTQQPTGGDGAVGVLTTLHHESGEFLSSSISLPLNSEKGKSMAQEAGSIITYLRRYALAGLLGLYADEDNDGHGANQEPPQTRSETVPHKPAPAPAPARPAPKPGSFEAIVDGDGGMQDCILVSFKEVSSKPDAAKPWTAWFCKFENDSGSEFEAGTFDKKLGEVLPTLQGQLCTIRTQPGRKPGTTELLSIVPVDNVP